LEQNRGRVETNHWREANHLPMNCIEGRHQRAPAETMERP
jgi:hypothetical protein